MTMEYNIKTYEKLKSIVEKIEVALDFKTPSEMMRIKTVQPYKTHTPSQEDAGKEVAKLMLEAHFLLSLLPDNGKKIEDIIDNDEIRYLKEIGVFAMIDFTNRMDHLQFDSIFEEIQARKDHNESKHNRFYDHDYENLPKKVFTGHDAMLREELNTVELKVDYIHMMLLEIMKKLEVE